MRNLYLTSLLGTCCMILAACGGSGGSSNSVSGPASFSPLPAPDGQAMASPANGQSRAGTDYRVEIVSPNSTAEAVVFQVLEPSTLTGGETYPLVLEGHGFGGSRQTGSGSGGGAGLASVDIGALRNAGYGVISIDQRGHGESGGTIRVMDPDAEGNNQVAILDWAQANLDWLAFGPDDDIGGSNPLVGATGLSYGGGYQMVLNAVDPRRRLDAIVPQITWNDLTFSLSPGEVIKSGWVIPLFTIGNTAGSGNNFDPFVTQVLTEGLTTNRISQDGRDFFRYHGQGYFCDGIPVATNGGPGTSPDLPPMRPGAINALFFQGFRDTLFNFNDAFANFDCLRQTGGDVRLLTYQSGHNTLQVVPDPGSFLFQPPDNPLISTCGDIGVSEATIAFFDEHLKGQAGAADAVLPRGVCLSLSGTDAVIVDDVTVGRAGTQFNLPDTTLIAGVTTIPIPADTGFTAGAGGDVLGGIPRIEVTVTDTLGSGLEPILFAGVGHMRASAPGIWDLVDNQILPLRGAGTHNVNLVGVAERLAPGDQLAILFYGDNTQFVGTGSVNAAAPAVVPVSVSGTAWLPLLGP